MTAGGWVTMIVALAFAWGLTAWCFWRVIKSPEEEKAPPGFGP